jgi:molecular chaperone DnaK
MPQIEVTFDIDANGILNVSAKDMATGKQQQIRIEASSGLTDQDIEKMVNDAKQNEGEDKKRREEVDTRNRADQLVFETEKNLENFKDQIDPDTKAKIEAGVQRVKKALEGSDMAEIKASSEDLQKIWHDASAKMYQQASAQQGQQPGGQPGGQAGSPSPDEGNTVDADYEVVND